MRDEKKWFRCTSRDQMVELITKGFDYTNFRSDKHYGGMVYYFERNDELDDFLKTHYNIVLS